jgi:hypothetical protein
MLSVIMLSVIMLSVIMLSVAFRLFFFYCSVECRYAECRYVKCRGAFIPAALHWASFTMAQCLSKTISHKFHLKSYLELHLHWRQCKISASMIKWLDLMSQFKLLCKMSVTIIYNFHLQSYFRLQLHWHNVTARSRQQWYKKSTSSLTLSFICNVKMSLKGVSRNDL